MTPPPRDEAVPLWIFRYCPGLYCDKEIHGDAASHVALPAAAYAALLTRVEAAEGALAWIAAQSCRRDAPCLELNSCATERCETCYARLALRASGTREGGVAP